MPTAEERKFLYKRVPKVQNFRQIHVPHKLHTFGFDLADYTGNEEGSNRGFIVCIVDYFTRYAMTEVIPKKDTANIEEALKNTFRIYGKPKYIHSDRESGLIHSQYLKNEGVEVYHSDTNHAHTSGGSPIAERFIQTLRSKLEQERAVTAARGWKQHVTQATYEYNTSIHRTIGMTPEEAFYTTVQNEVAQVHVDRMKEHEEKVKETEKPKKELKENAKVIIPREKKTFEKGYTQKWSDQVLTIKEVLNTVPTTYYLSNGRFSYASELQFLDDNKVKMLETKKTRQKKVINQPVASRTRAQTSTIKNRLRSSNQ